MSGSWAGVLVRGLVCLVLVVCGCGLVAGSVWAQDGACPNEPVRGEQSFGLGLADCRAFEMVSPLGKGDDSVNYHDSRAGVSGEAVSFLSPGSFAEPRSALLAARYVSRRGRGGWVTRNISPPFTSYVGAATKTKVPFEEPLFTGDLSRGVVESPFTPLVGGQPAGYVNLYVTDTKTGLYEAVSTVTPEAEYKPFGESFTDGSFPQVEGASSDLSHVVFQQVASLCCGASPHQQHVYEWAGGKLGLVDVPPEGGTLDGPDNVGSPATYQPAKEGDPWRAVSADGSRVIFTGGENVPFAGDESEGQVYVRENAMSGVEDCSVVGDACTVEVSRSQRSPVDPNAGGNPLNPAVAWYRDASVDGSRVFFTSRVELTDDANTGPEDNAANLYEYDLDTSVLSDLSVDNSDPNGAVVLGLVNASEDGSYVYFVAEGKLTGEKNGEGVGAVGGEPNLYLWHGGGVRFIATLAPDALGKYQINHEQNGDEGDWVGEEGSTSDFGPGSHTARVGGGGSVLVFESELELTRVPGFSDRAAAPGECENERCREVYLYDAVSGRLVCVSCNVGVGGVVSRAPVGPAGLGGQEFAFEPYYLPSNLSVGGGRLFFVSPDPLVSYDSNGRLDVYEWERVGEGSCSVVSVSYAASRGGCVFAVSDVSGGFDSHFMDASATGSDVFFATSDQLLGSDTDSREDVYDARVGGGFPVGCGFVGVCERGRVPAVGGRGRRGCSGCRRARRSVARETRCPAQPRKNRLNRRLLVDCGRGS